MIPSILLVVAIQLVIQIPLAVWMIAGHAETDTVVRVVIGGTLAYYGLVAAFVLWRFGGKEISPVWSSQRAGPSALVGVGMKPNQRPVIVAEPEAGRFPESSADMNALMRPQRAG